jgi:hypothetical protein
LLVLGWRRPFAISSLHEGRAAERTLTHSNALNILLDGTIAGTSLRSLF